MDTKTGMTRELLLKDREIGRKLDRKIDGPMDMAKDTQRLIWLMQQRKQVRAALESLNATE